MAQVPIALRLEAAGSGMVCCEDFMLVSFPMEKATVKRVNFSYDTSGRARHEGIFGSREYSRDFSRENAFISKKWMMSAFLNVMVQGLFQEKCLHFKVPL